MTIQHLKIVNLKNDIFLGGVKQKYFTPKPSKNVHRNTIEKNLMSQDFSLLKPNHSWAENSVRHFAKSVFSCFKLGGTLF